VNTAAPRPPLPRWIWITGAAVIAVAVVVGVILWAQRPTDNAAGPTPPTTAEPSSTPSPDSGIVTGCLAEGQTIDMLLTTQKVAPHSATGAVEFASAQMRMMKQWPWPSFEDYQAANSTTWAGGSLDQAQYDAAVVGPNASGGVVAEGTPFHLTTVLGRWYVDSYDGDTAQVTVGAAYVIGDAVSPQYRAVGTYNLEWTDKGWVTLSTEKEHTVQELFDDGLGSPYAGGC
jgi:hypothetical protein